MKINRNFKDFKFRHRNKKNQIIYTSKKVKNDEEILNLIDNFLEEKNSFIFESVEKGKIKEFSKKFIDNCVDVRIKFERKEDLPVEEYLIEDSEGNKIDIRDVPMNILPHHTDKHFIEINFTNKKGTTNPQFKKYE